MKTKKVAVPQFGDSEDFKHIVKEAGNVKKTVCNWKDYVYFRGRLPMKMIRLNEEWFGKATMGDIVSGKVLLLWADGIPVYVDNKQSQGMLALYTH